MTSSPKDPILADVKVLQAVSLAALPLLGIVLGCDKILGIDEKTYVDANGGGDGGGGGNGGGGGAASNPTCTLADAKDAAIRVMNAIPSSAVLDLCVKDSGTSTYGEPWFKSQSNACGPGVAYSRYTTDLGIAAGTYDFKLVASGDNCTSTGIEAPNIAIAKDESITLLAYGETLRQGGITPLKNRKAEGLNAALRFVHALNGTEQLTAGIAAKRELPATLSVPIFNDVPLGGIAKASEGGPLAIDNVYDDGYSLYAGGESTRVNLIVGVTPSGSTDVTLVAPIPVTPGLTYSIFAIGLQGSIEWLPKIWSCNETESDGLFLNCGNPINVSFEVFNSNLADAFTAYVAERTPQATKSIVSEPTDVLCVTELYDPKIKEAVKALSPAQLKYRAFSDDIALDIHQNMPLMQSGDPAPYSPIACPGDMALLFEDFLNCGRDATDPLGAECTTVDAQGSHHLAYPGERATGCFANKCTDKAVTLMSSDTEFGQGISCYMCGLTHLASYETFENTLAACTTENTAQPEHFAYDGTSGLAVLSVYPLGIPELVLLPSTGWLRAAMRVPVLLPNGTVIDHWCSSLRYPNTTEDELPYAGRYGMDDSGDPGAVAEQKYQIRTLVEAVQSRHQQSGTRALVGLVTYSGPELKDADGKKLVYGQQPDSYALLDAVWPRLVAPDYTPACTYCGSSTENPLNDAGATASFWSTHLFAEGLTPADVQSTERTFDDSRPVSILTPQGTLKTPISQHFGLRSVVTVTQ